MNKLEAIKVLETRLAAIEREHHDELAGEDTMSDTDARAEAKALAAVYDFLKDCKIPHRRFLRRPEKRSHYDSRGRDTVGNSRSASSRLLTS